MIGSDAIACCLKKIGSATISNFNDLFTGRAKQKSIIDNKFKNL
jgi:hypothetical protein